MAINTVTDAADQSLVEYHVGKAQRSCVFPAIQQCFAIVGVRATHMACTHVSPGSSAQDITDTFDALKDIGGTWASDWYVLGPCAHFFRSTNTPWTSITDVRAAFTAAFGDTGANHWIMDLTSQRENFGFGIDVRADFTVGNRSPAFSYKKGFARHITTWTALDAGDFARF